MWKVLSPEETISETEPGNLICHVHEKCLANGKQSKFQRQSSNRYQWDCKFFPGGTSKNNWRKHQEKRQDQKHSVILLSYTDKHKTEINKISANEKSKLCSSTFFRNIFEKCWFQTCILKQEKYFNKLIVFYSSWGVVFWSWKQTDVEDKEFVHWSYP